jgi:hypothetical protein
MRLTQSLAGLALACAAVIAVPGALARDLSVNECLEGGDFIRNAALSRDMGVSRGEFIGRMEADIQAIQAFPPQLRWFVQDEDDQVLLMTAAQGVFDEPEVPERHREEFVHACFSRVSAGGAPGPALATDHRQP